jgi:cell division control protein 6
MTFFDQAESKFTIFRNSTVLSPHYVPRDLPFRESQIKEIVSILTPALKAQKPRNIILYGKTGTGKTCCVKRIMEDFEGISKENAIIQYVNCRIYNTRYRILQKILKTSVPEAEKTGFGATFFYEKLVEIVSKGKQMIIVLDEIDMVKDLDELVYTLTRANDELHGGGVSIIGISNRLSFKDALDPRSKSSLYETEMVFPPYTAEQLRKILAERAKEGFVEESIEQSAINLAAAITSQETGDARYALKLINKAGEIAESKSKNKITDSDVEEARKKVEIDLTKETINTLPEMHQIVLHAIATLSNSGTKYSRLEVSEKDDKVLFSGEVFEEYEKICKNLGKKSRSLRWYKEYVSDLEVLRLVSTAISSKGIRGKTTLIKMGSVAPEIEKLTQGILFGNRGSV